MSDGSKWCYGAEMKSDQIRSAMQGVQRRVACWRKHDAVAKRESRRSEDERIWSWRHRRRLAWWRSVSVPLSGGHRGLFSAWDETMEEAESCCLVAWQQQG